MTLAIPAPDEVGGYAVYGPADAGCFCGIPEPDAHTSRTANAVARIDAFAWRAKSLLIELKPRWQPSEDEIARAAIAVILASLVAIIALAAGAAVTTMG
jgi:hypothetical protein